MRNTTIELNAEIFNANSVYRRIPLRNDTVLNEIYKFTEQIKAELRVSAWKQYAQQKQSGQDINLSVTYECEKLLRVKSRQISITNDMNFLSEIIDNVAESLSYLVARSIAFTIRCSPKFQNFYLDESA